jgi:hypothetical protein
MAANGSSLPVFAQLRTGLLLFAVVAGLSCVLDLFSRIQSLDDWFYRQSEDACRQTFYYLHRTGYYQVPIDQRLYEELPRMDVSKGGVYFVGSSEVEYATKFWEYPPELRSLVHNFGMPQSNITGLWAWLRCLTEHKKILQAGAQKTLVVIGAYTRSAINPERALPVEFQDTFDRHGLYSCEGDIVRPRHVNALKKFLDFEETRQATFMSRLANWVQTDFTRLLHHGVLPKRICDTNYLTTVRNDEMGPHWKEKVDQTTQTFGDMLNYLSSQHVHIRVIIMPSASWNFRTPSDTVYRGQIAALCANKHVPVSDWSQLLDDDDFADSNHANVYGMDKMTAAFVDIAVPFLRQTQALPPDWKYRGSQASK